MTLTIPERMEVAGFTKSHPDHNEAAIVLHYTRKWPKASSDDVKLVVRTVRG